jgi:hypothetical protein
MPAHAFTTVGADREVALTEMASAVAAAVSTLGARHA